MIGRVPVLSLDETAPGEGRMCQNEEPALDLASASRLLQLRGETMQQEQRLGNTVLICSHVNRRIGSNHNAASTAFNSRSRRAAALSKSPATSCLSKVFVCGHARTGTKQAENATSVNNMKTLG